MRVEKPDWHQSAEEHLRGVDELKALNPDRRLGTEYKAYPSEDASKDELASALERVDTDGTFRITISPTKDAHEWLWVSAHALETE